MLYEGSTDAIKKEFEDSVGYPFDIKFLGPSKWFLQMRIDLHKDKSFTLDQHCYVLNTLQCYNPSLKFPECETPLPPDYPFSKDNQPVTDHDSSSLKNNTNNAFLSALLCVRFSILPTTPVPISSLQFSNLQKPVSALEKPTSVLLFGL
jgi:hypothetical protein